MAETWELIRTIRDATPDFAFTAERGYAYRFRRYVGHDNRVTLTVGGFTFVSTSPETSEMFTLQPGQYTVKKSQDGPRDFAIAFEKLRVNVSPVVTINTNDSATLYEQDTYSLSGTVRDDDSGDTITVKYSINNGTARTLHTFVSDGSAVSFNKPLTFKRNKLYDGSTAVTGDLEEGVPHTLRVWAEDDQGGKSAVHSRTFNVIPNRPEVKVNGHSRVVETISCKVNGQAREVIKIWTKVNGELREV